MASASPTPGGTGSLSRPATRAPGLSGTEVDAYLACCSSLAGAWSGLPPHCLLHWRQGWCSPLPECWRHKIAALSVVLRTPLWVAAHTPATGRGGLVPFCAGWQPRRHALRRGCWAVVPWLPSFPDRAPANLWVAAHFGAGLWRVGTSLRPPLLDVSPTPPTRVWDDVVPYPQDFSSWKASWVLRGRSCRTELCLARTPDSHFFLHQS